MEIHRTSSHGAVVIYNVDNYCCRHFYLPVTVNIRDTYPATLSPTSVVPNQHAQLLSHYILSLGVQTDGRTRKMFQSATFALAITNSQEKFSIFRWIVNSRVLPILNQSIKFIISVAHCRLDFTPTMLA